MRKKYMKETKRLNEIVDKENKSIKKYNKKVDKVVKLINSLISWYDYVEFDNKKYGIPKKDKIKNGVHMENDCLGRVILDHSCNISTIIDDKICKNDCFKYYKCDCCNQMIEISPLYIIFYCKYLRF